MTKKKNHHDSEMKKIALSPEYKRLFKNISRIIRQFQKVRKNKRHSRRPR